MVAGDFEDRLRSVPWDSVEHAYGAATDVPDLILQTLSEDVDVRKNAWWDLHGNLWHQGTIYSATPHAVPFFIEMAADPETRDRAECLAYLGLLAGGSSFWDVHGRMSIAPADWHERRDLELGWVRDVKTKVRAGLPTYLALLHSSNPPTRTAAAYTISQCAEDGHGSLQALIDCYAFDDDSVARASILLAIAKIAANDNTASRFFERIVSKGAPDADQFIAALGLAWSQGESTGSRAREILAADAIKAEPVFREFPWAIGSAEELARSTLLQIGDVGALSAIHRALEAADPTEARDGAYTLLESVFPSPYDVSAPLSSRQLFALEAIVNSESLWADGETNPATVSILRSFNLPTTRSELRALASRTQP